MIEAANEILSAATTIAQYHAQQVKFDETKLCTIIEVQDEKKGAYLVSDGSIKFVAYATSGHYYVDEQVYVLVPGKDYEQQKIILGKRAEETSLIRGYEDAFTNCVITSHLSNNKKGQDDTVFLLGEKEESMAFDLSEKHLLTYEPGVNRFLIKMHTRCWPKDNTSFIMSGLYGIKIELAKVLYKGNVVLLGDTKEFLFLSDSMLGNPYAFENYYLQAIGFDLTSKEYTDFFTYGKYAYKITLITSDTFRDFDNNIVNFNEQYELRIANVTPSFGYFEKSMPKEDQIKLFCTQTDFTESRAMNDVWLTYLLFQYDAENDTFSSLTLTDYITKKQATSRNYNASNWYIYYKKDEDKYKRINSRTSEDLTAFGLRKGWKINGGTDDDWSKIKYQLITYIPTDDMEIDYTFSLFCRKNKIDAETVNDLDNKSLASLQDNYKRIQSNEVILRAAEAIITTRTQLMAACETITKDSFKTMDNEEELQKEMMVTFDGYQKLKLQTLIEKITMEEMED